MTSSLSPHRAALLMFLFVLVMVLIALGTHHPPKPLPADAPAPEFSAARAVKHLEAYARRPHRAGTDANYAVETYIVETLRGMGAEPLQTEATTVWGRTVSSPRNIIVRLPGTNSTKAFLFAGHYDSVPFGPGASDDGSGVASMLETYRALAAGPPLRNDVIFVFTDGEECGLCGAKSFHALHPWARDVGMMLNFEARGSCGPSYLFETNRNNGWLIPEIAKCAPYPIMSSAMFEMYDRTPFSSDYAVFKETIPGMNVAWLGKFYHYHTPNDSVKNISLSSLQHHGSYATAFARHFGNMDLNQVKTLPDEVYFNTIGSKLVHYPGRWNRPTGALALALAAAVLVAGLRRKRLTGKGVALGFGAFLLSSVCAVVVTEFFVVVALAVRGLALYDDAGYALRIWENVVCGMCVAYRNAYYGTAIVLMTVAAMAALHARYRRRLTVEDLAMGALGVWVVLLVLALVYAPWGLYVFAWPLLFGAFGLGVTFFLPANEPTASARLGVLAATAIPCLCLLVPLIWIMFVMGTVVLAPGFIVFAALLFGALIPQVELATAPDRRWLPVTFCAGGLVFFLAGLVSNGASATEPRFDSLSYALNADTGEAWWLGSDPKPDEWTSQFFPRDCVRGRISEFGFIQKGDVFLKAAAPVLDTPAPEAKVVADATENGERTLTLRIASPRGAARMEIMFWSKGRTRDVCVNGQPVDIARGRSMPHKRSRLRRQPVEEGPGGWRLNYSIFPRAGIELAIKMDASQPAKLKLLDYTYALPEFPDKGYRPRPPHIVNQPNTTNYDDNFQSDIAMVLKTFSF